MKKNAYSLIIKCTLLALPFIVVTTIYFVKDPYMVIRHYKHFDKSYFFLNESYVGWETYLNYKDSIHFNSFLLGNSCTMAFKCSSWEKYLKNDCHSIRLYGNAERLSSVYQKLKALDKMHAPLKNVLIIANISLIENSPLTPFATNILPPGEADINKLNFQYSFLQAFFVPSNLIAYLDYGIFHHYRKFMSGIINPYGVIRNPINCEAINPHEKEIAKIGDTYWVINKEKFPRNRIPKEHYPVIKQTQYYLFKEIKTICNRNGTNIKFIIGPEYDQVKLNREDLKILNHIFGKKNVYDYTGVNEYTDDIHNFYDPDHFRTIVGDKILQSVYGQSYHLHSD